MEQSLQEKYAPANSCWGCGPSNPDGLRIRSFAKDDEVVAEWKPQTKYEAFPGVLNGDRVDLSLYTKVRPRG